QERRAAQVAAAGADAALEAGLVAGADLAELDAGLDAAGQVADEGAEVDAVRGREVDLEDVVGVEVVDPDDLHREVVLADEALGDRASLGAAPPVGLVAGEVLLGGGAGAHGQAADVLRHPLRRPHALGHLGARVGGDEDLVAHLRAVRAGVEVVEAAVPGEADCHHHAHGYAPFARFRATHFRPSARVDHQAARVNDQAARGSPGGVGEVLPWDGPGVLRIHVPGGGEEAAVGRVRVEVGEVALDVLLPQNLTRPAVRRVRLEGQLGVLDDADDDRLAGVDRGGTALGKGQDGLAHPEVARGARGVEGPDLVLDLPELAPDRTDGTPDERERRVGPREAADTAGRLCRPHRVVAGLGGNDLHAGAGALVGDVGDAVAVGADGEFRPLGGRAGDADVGDVLKVLGTPVLVQVEALERHLWARVGRDDVRAVPHGRDPVEAAVRRRRDGQAHVLAGLDVADDEGGTGL